MEPNPLLLEVSDISELWHSKLKSYFSDRGFKYYLRKNTFSITLNNPKELDQITDLLTALKEKPFLEALINFPSLDVEDLFLNDIRIPFMDVLPFLEILDAKGIVFDFGEKPSDSSWLVDANDCVKLIPQEEHHSLFTFETRLGALLPKARESTMSLDWFLNLGINYLSKLYLSHDPEVSEDMDQVLDFLNAFSREEIALETELNADPANLERLTTLRREKESVMKASYSENLAKAPAFFVRLSKRLSKEEDWDGLKEVFKYKDYTVFQLLSEKNKDRESAIMQHCVGNGGYDLSSGIYSLRDKTNLPLATIEIDEHGAIIQIQGLTNRELSPKALPVIKHFISDYLKLDPSELTLDINTGWAKVKLIYPEFDLAQNIYISSEEISSEVANHKYRFFIKSLNWKEELEKEFTNLNTPLEIRRKVLEALDVNPPFVLKTKILGFTFDKAIKVPNIQRLGLIEELAALIHENLKFFDDSSTAVVRQINYNFKRVRTAEHALDLLSQFEMYFQRGLNTKRWATLNAEVLQDHLHRNPVPTFKFYRSYLKALKKLNPESSVTFEPSLWLEIFGNIFPDNLLEQPFLKLVESLKDLAHLINDTNTMKLAELEAVVPFTKELNPTQSALLKKHIKNLKKSMRDFNQELNLFSSENTDFMNFFIDFNLQALDSFDFFVLEEKPDPKDNKQYWLLNQQVKFVLFHINKFKHSLTSPSFSNLNFALNEVLSLYNKINLLMNFNQNPSSIFVDKTPREAMDNLLEEIKEYTDFVKSIEKLTKEDSVFNNLSRIPSQDIVLEILETWTDTLKHSRVTAT